MTLGSGWRACWTTCRVPLFGIRICLPPAPSPFHRVWVFLLGNGLFAARAGPFDRPWLAHMQPAQRVMLFREHCSVALACTDHAVLTRARQLELRGPTWQAPSVQHVLRALPFLHAVPDEVFERILEAGILQRERPVLASIVPDRSRQNSCPCVLVMRRRRADRRRPPESQTLPNFLPSSRRSAKTPVVLCAVACLHVSCRVRAG